MRRAAGRSGRSTDKEAVQKLIAEHKSEVYRDRSVSRQMVLHAEACLRPGSTTPPQDSVLYMAIDGCDQASWLV